MERRGPDDAWDESWDGNDDDVASSYPPAPLPAHERPWRHPSEVGQAQWQHTEPPIAIGRGLLVTTGAIGCVLGIAVLMLLVPLGGGLAPTAAPTATSSFAITDDGIGPATTTARSELQSGSSSSALLLPAEQVPSTVLVGPVATSAGQAPVRSMAIAVSIADQPFMVTTAHAVIAASGISIIGPGESATGTVVSVGGDLAFIVPGHAIEVASFSAIATAEPGQEVTVLSDEPTEVAYAPDGGVPELDPSTVLEGTPVVDADGALVALCTLVVDGDGSYVDMVPIALPDDGAVGDTSTTAGTDPAQTPPVPTTTTTPSTTPTTTTPAVPASPPSSSAATPAGALVAWAGLRFDGAPASAPLTVTGVAPASPAAAAGITAGDRITSVVGTPVGTVDDLLVEIRRHAPGEVITLTVVPRSATSTATSTASITVSVTLGAVPNG